MSPTSLPLAPAEHQECPASSGAMASGALRALMDTLLCYLQTKQPRI